MKILIVNNAEPSNNDFVSPIENILHAPSVDILLEASVETETISYSNLVGQDLSPYSGVILSASPGGDDIVENHLRFYEWIKSYDKPILGICSGHQIIGRLYGSELIRETQQEIGDLEVYITKDDPIFDGLNKRFTVRQAHNDSITLPTDFALLASSDKCEVQVMKHKSKPIYTTQFHVEALNPEIILNYLDIVKNHKT